jgi:hypothetical protein
MIDGCKFVFNIGPYSFSRRIRIGIFGILFFELDQLSKHVIVLGIGDLGISQDIVLMVVIFDQTG